MILIDLSQISMSGIHVNLGNDANRNNPNAKSLIKHMIINTILSYKKKYGAAYGEVVLAIDNRHYWRRERFPQYKGNRKKAREKSAEWKEKNPRKAKRGNHFYYIHNKEKYDNHDRARRARKYGANHHAYNLSQVVERYGLECWVCHTDIDLSLPRTGHKTMGLHLDHLIPLIKGGHDKLGNIRPTHGVCNLRKGDSLMRVNLLAK